MTRSLYYAGMPGGTWGWGVANTNLIRELAKCMDVTGPWSKPLLVETDAVFILLGSCDLIPYMAASGKRRFGYAFFEEQLAPLAVENARKYETIFCGSTWCLERMQEVGISNGKVLVQGVDPQIFFPTARPPKTDPEEFRVFSGGKFEFRKGQDLVIAAFRQFIRSHPKAKLVCAWDSEWPGTVLTMSATKHIAFRTGKFADQQEFHRMLLVENGIPARQVEVLPRMSQQELAAVMRSTDIGIFPNRCEGGTNLVLMEYLACAGPVVATNSTGHRDVLSPANAMTLTPRLNASFWDEPDVCELAGKMELLWGDSNLRSRLGAGAAESMKQWTWERAAKMIADEIFRP